MKKTAIIFALCMVALSGCGKVDTVDIENVKPFEIETEDKNTEDDKTEKETNNPAVTTVSTSSVKGVTTAKTGAVNLVKRTGVVGTRKPVSAGKNTSPSRPAVSRPANNNSHTTAAQVKTTAAQTQASTAVITTAKPVVQTPAPVVKDNVSCEILSNGIQVSIKGEPAQIISADTSYIIDEFKNGNTDSSATVNIVDFDFDGDYDLFIPSSKTDYNTFGTFYRYDSETDSFSEWSDLTGIGKYAVVDSDNETISFTDQTSDIEYEKRIYCWKVIDEDTGEKEFTLQSLVKQFRLDSSDEYDIYIDYYEYPNGTETIIKREKHIYDENNQFLGVQEIPIEWYIR